MSYIPDCRTDEFYNYEKLNEQNKKGIDGYDWAIEEVIDNLFDNLDFLEDDVIERFSRHPYDFNIEYDMEYAFGNRQPEHREVKTYGDYIRYKMLEWAEMQRDELITSMIDGQQNDDEG